MFEPQERDKAFFAERQIEASDQGAVTVEAKADAVGHLHVAERQVLSRRCYRPGIHEKRPVKRPPCFPPVLGAQKQSVLVSKSGLAEPAQVSVTAERGLKVERHGLAAVRVREHVEEVEPLLVHPEDLITVERREWGNFYGRLKAVKEQGLGALGPYTACVVVLGHGAGNDLRSSFLEFFAAALPERGLTVVRFNFPYREQRSGRPDSMPVLTESIASVAENSQQPGVA